MGISYLSYFRLVSDHCLNPLSFQIENFTVSFSDGRALCYLLHHYHPSLLPRSLIKEQTSLTCNPGVRDVSDSEGEEGMDVNSWTATFSPGKACKLFPKSHFQFYLFHENTITIERVTNLSKQASGCHSWLRTSQCPFAM